MNLISKPSQVWSSPATLYYSKLRFIIWLIHYLDDYFIAGPPNSSSCATHLQSFLEVCGHLGAIAMDKVEGPTTNLTFLGLQLDSAQQQIKRPPNKLNKLLLELRSW